MTTPAKSIDAVDFDILGTWMDGEGLPSGPFENVAPIGGGTQNLLLRFTRGGREYVLRRPPRHPRPSSNEVLRREARLLSALDGTEVPAPKLIAACTDESVLGDAVFYLMEPVDGFNPATDLSIVASGNALVRKQMGPCAVAALAQLGALDHQALGLGDFGKPEGFLERQVPRWLKELESYSANAGYGGPELPGLETVADWLTRNRPAAWTPGIMHGDFHLANLMFRHDGPELAAMVDWEMATIGDPLLDLGWLLATWPDGSVINHMAPELAAAGDLASEADLVAAYRANSTRDLDALDWYVVLACFKLGIVLEGTHARATAGKAPKPVGDLLHSLAVRLFEKAGQRI